MQRRDLRRMQNSARHPRLRQFMQQHRIDHHASRGIEPEGHIGKPAGELHIRERLADPLGPLNQFRRTPPIRVHSSRDRQHQRINKQIRHQQSMHRRRPLDRAFGDLKFAIRRPRHRVLDILINRPDHQRRAVVFRHLTQLVKLIFAFFKVCAVDDALARRRFESREDDLWIRRIQHQRRINLLDNPRNHLVHIRRVVASRDIHIDVQHMRPIPNLLTRQRHDPLEILFLKQPFELPRSRRVAPLPNNQDRQILSKLHR